MNDEVRKSEKMTLTKVSEIFKTNGAYVQVAQLDLDGNGEPWFAMYGAMPVELNVQRIFQRFEMQPWYLAFNRLSGTCVIYTDNSWSGGGSAKKRRSNLRWSTAQGRGLVEANLVKHR